MKKIYITGVSGTGKTTLGLELSRRGFFTLDIDTISKWVNNKTGERNRFFPGIGREFLDNHSWVTDEDEFNKILDENKDKTIFILGIVDNDIFFRKIFDKIFLLQCNIETAFKRIDIREDNEFGKHDSEKEWILSWYQDFERDLINSGAISINTERPIEAVADDILSKI